MPAFFGRAGNDKKKPETHRFRLKNGAAARIRTGDLILTKDALYLLSYSSILYPTGFNPWGVATEKGLEPSASSVTG